MLACGGQPIIKGQKTFIMGIINTTPDSFSDGGQFYSASDAVCHGLRLLNEGADILDVGGVSTAPNRALVSEQEEMARVIPVIEGLVAQGIRQISVDTMRASVAQEALNAGASWINDQSAGLFDAKMPRVMAQADGVVLMHNGGGLTSGVEAGEAVQYHDVVEDIKNFFEGRIQVLSDAGILPSKIIVDPGIGFGKGLNDSLAILSGMGRFSDLGVLSLIGVSRKSVIGTISGIQKPQERDVASLGAVAVSVLVGASIVRAHNVRAVAEFFRVFDVVRRAG